MNRLLWPFALMLQGCVFQSWAELDESLLDDGDVLDLKYDPCPEHHNRRVANFFAENADIWSSVMGGRWEVDPVNGARATTVGDAPATYASAARCPGAGCSADYVIDVIAHRGDDADASFGVLGDVMSWESLLGYRCKVEPSGRMTLDDASGRDSGVSADMDSVPLLYAVRLVVHSGRQWCIGQRDGDPVLESSQEARQSPEIGLYVSLGGEIVFQSVQVYEIPDGCDLRPARPPPP